jgi:hypothetical protein
VTFPIMLTGESFSTDGAYEWSLICMCSKMRPEIVRPCESLRTKRALERGGVFLNSFSVTVLEISRGRLVVWISKTKNIVPIRKRGSRLTTPLTGG